MFSEVRLEGFSVVRPDHPFGGKNRPFCGCADRPCGACFCVMQPRTDGEAIVRKTALLPAVVMVLLSGLLLAGAGIGALHGGRAKEGRYKSTYARHYTYA